MFIIVMAVIAVLFSVYAVCVVAGRADEKDGMK